MREISDQESLHSRTFLQHHREPWPARAWAGRTVLGDLSADDEPGMSVEHGGDGFAHPPADVVEIYVRAKRASHAQVHSPVSRRLVVNRRVEVQALCEIANLLRRSGNADDSATG